MGYTEILTVLILNVGREQATIFRYHDARVMDESRVLMAHTFL